MLGKIVPRFFPHVFGPKGDEPLDRDVVEKKFAELASEIQQATGDKRSPREVAEGFVHIAVENMANAIKQISIERGYDVTEYTLCCFGGAGGQHACLIADTLGMKRVYIHPLAGVLSAYGMGLADLRAIKEQAVEARLEQSLLPRLDSIFADLTGAAAAEMHAQGVEPGDITMLKKALIKYEGTDVPLAVDYGDLDRLRENFAAGAQAALRFRRAGKSADC